MARNCRYTKLFDFVVEMHEINDTQKIVLSKIMSFESNGLTAHMGNNYFAKTLGLSTRQIRRHLQHLEELELIIRIQTPNGRVLKTGPKCPTPWTKKTSSLGQKRPTEEDEIDHLLDQVNRHK